LYTKWIGYGKNFALENSTGSHFEVRLVAIEREKEKGKGAGLEPNGSCVAANRHRIG
jgi:hypothetical protein